MSRRPLARLAICGWILLLAQADTSAAGLKCRTAETTPSGTRVCIGRIAGYPNDVSVVVPASYTPTTTPEVVLYLHGNNHGNESIRSYLNRFQVPQAMASSGRNALMIMPLSRGPKTAQHEAALTSAEGYRRFMAGALKAVTDAGVPAGEEPGKIVLAGHSGAYRSLSGILAHGTWSDRTHELYLLDAVYNAKHEFVEFAGRPENRMWTVSTETGGTPKTTACLQNQLTEAGVGYFGCATYRCACCTNALPEPSCSPLSDFTAGDWTGERVGFLHSSVSHDAAARDFLPRFLRGQ